MVCFGGGCYACASAPRCASVEPVKAVFQCNGIAAVCFDCEKVMRFCADVLSSGKCWLMDFSNGSCF